MTAYQMATESVVTESGGNRIGGNRIGKLCGNRIIGDRIERDRIGGLSSTRTIGTGSAQYLATQLEACEAIASSK